MIYAEIERWAKKRRKYDGNKLYKFCSVPIFCTHVSIHSKWLQLPSLQKRKNVNKKRKNNK